MFFRKLKVWRIRRWWKKYGRKDAFTWVHYYLRLHKELWEDPVYKAMLDYHRATLIAYFRRDLKKNKMTDEQLGEFVDVLADIYNRHSADRVERYKELVDGLYNICKNDPSVIKEVRI